MKQEFEMITLELVKLPETEQNSTPGSDYNTGNNSTPRNIIRARKNVRDNKSQKKKNITFKKMTIPEIKNMIMPKSK